MPSTSADFLHRHFIGVIKDHHLLVAVRQRRHGFIENETKLLASAHVVGLCFRSAGIFRRGKVFMFGRSGVRGDQADVAQFHHHLTPAIDVDSEPLGDFSFGGCSLQFGGEVPSSRLYLLVPAAKIPGCPIELPQAVEDRALYAVFRIAGKRNLFIGIVFSCRIE